MEVSLNKSVVPINFDMIQDGWMVSDLLTEDGSWNIDFLHSNFSEDMVNSILTLPIPKNHCQDQLGCGGITRTKVRIANICAHI